MRKLSKVLSVVMSAVLVLGMPLSVFAEEQTMPTEESVIVTDTPVIILGWNEIDGEIYYYCEDGTLATGMKTIDGGKFYFDQNGVLAKGWKTISGKKYYFNKSGEAGIVGAAVTGRKKIDKKWYFFSKKGVLQKKNVKENNVTYYINSSGNLEAYRKKSDYYKPNGKKMTAYEKSDYTTLQTARKIVSQITNDKMSKKEKLSTCFWWVSKKPYIQYRKFKPTKDWPAVYANDHFKRKGGDCHADGSAFAYLARALGYKNVYVCLDCDGRRAQGHCWTEINGKVYDPLFVTRKGGKKKYYGGSYKTYNLRPILHLEVAKGY